jgi:hypothetical protein
MLWTPPPACPAITILTCASTPPPRSGASPVIRNPALTVLPVTLGDDPYPRRSALDLAATLGPVASGLIP